jgi:hypothetical protein
MDILQRHYRKVWTRERGEAVAITHLLKFVAFDSLTDKQKADMKQRFIRHKAALQDAIKAVDQGIAALDNAPKAGAAAKKKAARRSKR